MESLAVRGQIVNLARYMLLLEAGGLYMDVDVEPRSEHHADLNILLRCNQAAVNMTTFVGFVEGEIEDIPWWPQVADWVGVNGLTPLTFCALLAATRLRRSCPRKQGLQSHTPDQQFCFCQRAAERDAEADFGSES